MKQNRQKKILEIISKYNIETQDELLTKLTEEGVITTQATISRDIRELNLKKESKNGGKQKYVALEMTPSGNLDSYKQVLSAGIISMETAENLIVIKTVSGVAMAVGAALDSMKINGLIGCIAGDDTIFLAVKSHSLTGSVMAEIEKVSRP